jgi:hypothetical protein
MTAAAGPPRDARALEAAQYVNPVFGTSALSVKFDSLQSPRGGGRHLDADFAAIWIADGSPRGSEGWMVTAATNAIDNTIIAVRTASEVRFSMKMSPDCVG